jgi:hypothetical protein
MSNINNNLNLPVAANKWLPRLNSTQSPLQAHPFETIQKQRANTSNPTGLFSQRATEANPQIIDRFTQSLQGVNQFATVDGARNLMSVEGDIKQTVAQQGGPGGYNSFGGLGNVGAMNQAGQQTNNSFTSIGDLKAGMQTGQSSINTALVGGLTDSMTMGGTDTYNTTTLAGGARQVTQQGDGSFQRLNVGTQANGTSADQVVMAGKKTLIQNAFTGDVKGLANMGEDNISINSVYGNLGSADYQGKGRVVTNQETGERTYTSAHRLFISDNLKEARLAGDTNYYNLNTLEGSVGRLALEGKNNQGTVFINGKGEGDKTLTVMNGTNNQWNFSARGDAQQIAVRGNGNQFNIATSTATGLTSQPGQPATGTDDALDLGGSSIKGTADLGDGDDAVLVRRTTDGDTKAYQVTLYGGAGKNTLQLEGANWFATKQADGSMVYKRKNQQIIAYDFQGAQGVPIGSPAPKGMPSLSVKPPQP